MKTIKLLSAALIAATMAGTASAQTVINITGATAFRQAAHLAIQASLDPGYTWGYNNTNIGNTSRAIFKGTINDGAEQVVIRTSWSGSVAGIKAIVENGTTSVSYFDDAIGGLTTEGTANLSTAGANSESTTLNFVAFADNAMENTPFDPTGILGDPVGIIVFVPAINETALMAQGESVSAFQLGRMMTAGKAPLQFLTGDALDANKKVYWTGRRDTSGTRAIYLCEMGLGASRAVNQYRVEPLDSTKTTATAVQLWPANDSGNASTLWQASTAGNGGYESGGNIGNLLQRTSTSIVEKDANGTTVASGVDAVLLTVISVADAQSIQEGGGNVLAYNGVYIEPELVSEGGLSEGDKDKIRKGQYTLWSYQRLFYREDADQVTQDFVALLQANVSDPANIGGNGLDIGSMRVSRPANVDGGQLTVAGSLL